MARKDGVIIRVDGPSQALIERCATTLSAHGLEDVIMRMAEAGLFREAVTIRKGFQSLVVVGLGPMTELLLLEYIDVAERHGWSERMKRSWMQAIAEMAGFAEAA